MPQRVVRQVSEDGVHWETEIVDDEGGGGGTPGGADTQVQFNDAGVFGGSANLVFDDSAGDARLMLQALANGIASIIGNGAGVQIHIIAGEGDASHVGGEIVLRSGDSAGQNGGDITIEAGTDSDGGTGGNITIQAGGSPDGDGGELQLRAGSGDGGGRVLIQGGTPDGYVRLDGAAGGVIDVITPDGIMIDAFGGGKIGFFGATPVTKETGVAVTAAAIHAALVRLGLIAA